MVERFVRSRGRSRPRSTAFFAAALTALLGVALPVLPASSPASAATLPYSVHVVSDDGHGRTRGPGRACSDGAGGAQAGTGAYWHYEYSSDLAPGLFSALDAETLTHLDLHSDTQRFPNVDGYPTPAGTPTAFLQGSESHTSLLNDRGSVKLRLASGTCAAPTLAFDGSVATGGGTWVVDSGSGAYEDITGSGTFTLNAEVNPGADNHLQLDLAGSLDLPIPTLDVSVAQTYWASLGTDYLSRRVSVVYRVTNTGPGDAIGAVVTGIAPSNGAAAMTGAPIPLGDLRAGQSTTFTIRHQLNLLGQPCTLIILGCRFDVGFNVDLPDALDRHHVQTDVVTAVAPLLPPPL